MSVYKYLDHKQALQEIFEERRLGVKKWTLRKLAVDAGLQPSFMTNVLKERADFSADQLYSVCEQLGLAPAERRYLLLLLDHHRCVHSSRRKELKAEIDEIRRDHQKTEKHIANQKVALTEPMMAEYYLDPLVQLVHVHLTIPPYDRDPEAMCPALGISKEHLVRVLAKLERIGYIRQESGRHKVVSRGLHLPKENPLCNPHQAMMRIRSIDHLQRLDDKEKYSFSATISGTDDTRARLQDEFMAFLKRAEAIVGPAPSEKAMQMNFDLFSWKI